VFPVAYLQSKRGKSSLTERLEEKSRYATASKLDVASTVSFPVVIRSS
jgi:ABC-type Fe3+ transport system permease subunit